MVENAQAEAQYRKMTETKVSRLIIGLSIPTIISMLVTSIYNLADTYFVSGLGTSQSAATGVVAGKPYPGEEEFLGRGVSYCATCDGAFYKGKKTAVIGGSEKEEEEADFLTEYAEEVLYFPLYQGEVHTNDKVTVIRERPVSILGDQKVTALKTAGNEYQVDGIFVLRDAVAPGQLVPGLETDGPHVKVKLDMSTSIPGLYAAGDIAGLPYQYIKAAGQGNVAALSAAGYLATRKTAK